MQLLAGPGSSARRTRILAAVLGVCLFCIYNANGREIGAIDTQPTKFAAVEIALRGTVTLDHVIEQNPRLARRPTFTRDRQGHWRSAYPVLPSVVAGIVAIGLDWTGLVDLNQPMAPDLVAVLTASAATAIAVAVVFLTLARLTSARIALLVAIGLGLGTNYWTIVSRTLWQDELVALGTALALWAGLRPARDLQRRHVYVAGLGLAMALAARPQVAPLVAVMLFWFLSRMTLRTALPAIAITCASGIAFASLNIFWFGHPLGAMVRLEALHPEVHNVTSSLGREPWVAAAGLLFSPSRGLLVYSPIVAIAILGLWRIKSVDRSWGLPALALAAGAQLAAYSFYSVWWGGHTYGPRYALDLLVPIAPFATFGVQMLSRSTAGRAAGSTLLFVSIAVAALGAFVYPNERWNTSPRNVDQHHARLWDFRDSQIARAIKSKWNPVNFALFSPDLYRTAEPARVRLRQSNRPVS